MLTLPSRDQLRMEFDAAILEIDASRNASRASNANSAGTGPGSKLTTEFYSRIGDHVFDAGYSALADASAASLDFHVGRIT